MNLRLPVDFRLHANTMANLMCHVDGLNPMVLQEFGAVLIFVAVRYFDLDVETMMVRRVVEHQNLSFARMNLYAE